MRLLLDTQILVWLASDREQLTAGERAAIEGGHEMMVSVLSVLELRIKARAERRKGRPPTVLSPSAAIAFCAARELPIQPLVAGDCTFHLVSDPPHCDPIDEMLLAHAAALGAQLLTRDRQLTGHPLAYPL